MKKSCGIVEWNFKPRKGRTAAEMVEWNALDAEERDLRRRGISYLINCIIQARGAALFSSVKPIKGDTALAVGLKGYYIIPIECYAELKYATTGALLRALIKRLLNLCKRA